MIVVVRNQREGVVIGKRIVVVGVTFRRLHELRVPRLSKQLPLAVVVDEPRAPVCSWQDPTLRELPYVVHLVL